MTRFLVVILWLFFATPLLSFDEVYHDYEVFGSENGEHFGGAVAVDGDVVVIGAGLYSVDSLTKTGAAYILKWDSEAEDWVEQQILLPVDAEDYDYRGWSVDIERGRVVVGAPGAGIKGKVHTYIYDKALDGFVEDHVLEPSDLGVSKSFGIALDLCGGTLLVGATDDREEGRDAGAAYVYEWDRSTAEWVEDQKLLGDGIDEYDQFGYAVAVLGDTIVVGATEWRYSDEDDRGPGAAYVFEYDRDDEEWYEVDKLVASDGQVGDFFGGAVELVEDRVFIGAERYDDALGEDMGALYVFERGIDGWEEVSQFWPDEVDADDRFGAAIDCQSGRLFVAAARGEGDAKESGVVYGYRLAGGEWEEDLKLIPKDSGSSRSFGRSLEMEGDVVVVGAYRNFGSTYLYHLAGSDFLRGDVDGDGEVRAEDDANYLLEWAFLGGPSLDCQDAADADDDGRVSALLDASYLLTWELLDGPAPAAPGVEECGTDPTTDLLGCSHPQECL